MNSTQDNKMNTKSQGIWDEKSKTYIKPAGTVKQGRRPMFQPFPEHDHLIAGEKERCFCSKNTDPTHSESPEQTDNVPRLLIEAADACFQDIILNGHVSHKNAARWRKLKESVKNEHNH